MVHGPWTVNRSETVFVPYLYRDNSPIRLVSVYVYNLYKCALFEVSERTLKIVGRRKGRVTPWPLSDFGYSVPIPKVCRDRPRWRHSGCPSMEYVVQGRMIQIRNSGPRGSDTFITEGFRKVEGGRGACDEYWNTMSRDKENRLMRQTERRVTILPTRTGHRHPSRHTSGVTYLSQWKTNFSRTFVSGDNSFLC